MRSWDGGGERRGRREEVRAGERQKKVEKVGEHMIQAGSGLRWKVRTGRRMENLGVYVKKGVYERGWTSLRLVWDDEDEEW